jgi:hypothetical protein
MSLLTKFLDKYKKEPDRYPMLNPMRVNLFGDSLFHVVAKAKNSLKETSLLCEKGVKSNIRDREGKLPAEYLKSDNDERMQVSKSKIFPICKYMYVYRKTKTFIHSNMVTITFR